MEQLNHNEKPNPENHTSHHSDDLRLLRQWTRHTSHQQTLRPAACRRHHRRGRISGCAKKQPAPDLRHADGQTRMVAAIAN